MITAPAILLPWDTDFFGVRTARAKAPIQDDGAREHLLSWCREARVEWLHVLVPADDVSSVRQMEVARASLVDIRVNLAMNAAEVSSILRRDEGLRMRDYTAGDIERLQEIARSAHTDSRFFNDPRLPAGQAAALYEEWLRKSCTGNLADVVVIADQSGSPIAYATAKIVDVQKGVVGLVGVDRSARGRGVGGTILCELVNRLRQRGVRRVEVVTQGRNVAAQRLYQRTGFTVSAVGLWYHMWFVLQ